MTSATRALAVVLILLAAAAPAAGEARLGDAERGAANWDKCRGCHQVGPEAVNRIGPQLNGIFGRPAAAVPEFFYSDAMRRAGADGLTWTLETLDRYIENPKSLVSGTRMSFRGLRDAGERADLLAYLRGFSDNPANIPEAAPTATGTDHTVAPEILAIQGDAEYGAYLSSECTTCHRADGADEGIPSITRWPVDDFVVALHAYRDKVRPHPVMQMIVGRLNDEEIAALAAYFNDPD